MIHKFVAQTGAAVASTYQAAGAIGAAQFTRFAGRVGLSNNQRGDRLLDQADMVVTVGYSPVEYDPQLWSRKVRRPLAHIDVLHAMRIGIIGPPSNWSLISQRRWRCLPPNSAP